MIRILVLLTAMLLVSCGGPAFQVADSETGGRGTGGESVALGSAPTGVDDTGGALAAGAGTGGSETGGAITGGTSTGGRETGGQATGGSETGGVITGGAPTGGASTGGTSTGGVSTGGSPTGGMATGGTGGQTEPACSWQDAVTGIPKAFTWQSWQASNTFENRCAQCDTEPCGQATTQVEELTATGLTVSLSFGTAPVLIGGLCGGMSDSCDLTGTGVPEPWVHVGWELYWTGSAWAALPDESDAWSNPQCYLPGGGDIEPWSRNSMLADLIGELADWIVAIEWRCP